jgi:hypothetical protein
VVRPVEGRGKELGHRAAPVVERAVLVPHEPPNVVHVDLAGRREGEHVCLGVRVVRVVASCGQGWGASKGASKGHQGWATVSTQGHRPPFPLHCCQRPVPRTSGSKSSFSRAAPSHALKSSKASRLAICGVA